MNSQKVPITIAIITKNAEYVIKEALTSSHRAAQLLVIDQMSSDQTVEIAKQHHATVVNTDKISFATRRNLGLANAKYPWIMYLDADERMSPKLWQEIEHIIVANKSGVYRVRRDNVFLGTKMYPDYVERLFHKDKIKKWTGKVHETAQITGPIKTLENSLLHITHTDITSMLDKTNSWTDIEAELHMNANHPPVYWWRLIRMILTKGWEQFGHKKLLKFGREGLFEGYFQIINTLITYTKLWELQNTKAEHDKKQTN